MMGHLSSVCSVVDSPQQTLPSIVWSLKSLKLQFLKELFFIEIQVSFLLRQDLIMWPKLSST